ncbi:MAG: Outer membrane protein assembly factor BamD [Phycisphaerae bacterium]|nr:Outer membrane protein assembly factor BamD [Phycisphaerae bacterium]
MIGRSTPARASAWYILLLLASSASAQPAPPNPDDAEAARLLAAARNTYSQRNYPAAVQQFRQYLTRFAARPEAADAQFGLGMALLDQPGARPEDLKAAAEALKAAAEAKGFADPPAALYWLGAAHRDQGVAALAQAVAHPEAAAQHRAAAEQAFGDAAARFAAAAAAFAQRARSAPADRQAIDLAWSARARCDRCRMLLCMGKNKEALAAADAILTDAALAGPAAADSRALALYLSGDAAYRSDDLLAAGRTLSRLAPFDGNFDFIPQTRYLLGRIHHRLDQQPEAAAQYKAALDAFEQQKKSARQKLGNPAALTPQQRDACRSLANGPAPDFVVRATYYLAILQADLGRFSEAVQGFAALLNAWPRSPLAPQAQLRLGYCQLQLRNLPEAVRWLTPLLSSGELGDRAGWWLARAQVAGADRNNAPAWQQALAAAIANLKAAADKAASLAKSDPAAAARRADMLLELSDLQQSAARFADAAATCAAVVADKVDPLRGEQALQRQVEALHLAGQYAASDAAAERFLRGWPRSTLAPAVLFRQAENAYLLAVAATAAEPPAPQADRDRLFAAAVDRYRGLIARYPDFDRANLARLGLATALYQLGKFDDAAAALADIPEPDRVGELAAVPYLLADCTMRALPPESPAADALVAARVIDRADRCARLLEGYVAAAPPDAAQLDDALVKLGCCYLRLAGLVADKPERDKVLVQARTALERALAIPGRPSRPAAHYEHARCVALQGDLNAGIEELGRFRPENPNYGASPIAALGMLRQATYLRAAGRSAEAAAVLDLCRKSYEQALLKDPVRTAWVPAIQYEQAAAAADLGKPADARTLFEALARQFPRQPEATDAVWQAARCARLEATPAAAAAAATLARPLASAQEIAAAEKALDAAAATLAPWIDALAGQAETLATLARGSESHLRMEYELANCHRFCADARLEKARRRLARELRDKATPPGQAPGPLPDVAPAAVPVDPVENLACKALARLIAAAPQAELATAARIELAELHRRRGHREAAVALLAEALENSPPADQAKRIRRWLAELNKPATEKRP